MKLIIDIDDEMVCNDIKNKALEPTSATDKVIINALYNSTPISTEGDLISRSDLKQVINKVVDEEIGIDEKWAKGLKYSLKIIDTVLTVSERPQGEWVGNAFDEHHCNSCGHPALWEEEPDGYYEVQSDFCPYCGADMRGGAE